jgi:hypothetical protein
MNKKLWRGVVVGGVMAIGLSVVPGSLSLNTWVAGPMISDPMDLNHLEAQGQHARWAAQVKAAKEEAARKEAEAAAEAARKAAEAVAAPRRTAAPPKANTTPPTKAAPVQQAPRDQWMDTYNYWSARLPGTWAIGDKGSWGAAVPDTGQVWIARRTPLYALQGVMLHESCHVRQGRAFGGYAGAKAALAPYGGVERTADACAKNMGATWIGYGVDAKAFEGARLF